MKNLALDRSNNTSGNGWKDLKSTYTVDRRLPHVCLDIVGDILSLFSNLRTLDLTWAFPMVPSADVWLPHTPLTRPTPIDVAYLSMRVTIQEQWLPLHRALLVFFNSIKTLKLDLVAGHHTGDHTQLPGRGGNICRGVRSLKLTMDRDDERSLYLYKHFSKLLDFSDVTSLSVHGKLFAPRVQSKFEAVLAHTSNLTHLAIDFADDLWGMLRAHGMYVKSQVGL